MKNVFGRPIPDVDLRHRRDFEPRVLRRDVEREHFDVVVSDMRMPMVDGATFLAQVRERYPAAARIVLSGHGEREAVMRVMPVTHQLRRASIEGATLAKRFLAQDKSADEAFTSGLVRDIGQIVLVTGLPDRYRRIVRDALDSGMPLHAVEREHFGVSHAEVGAYLLGICGLPLSIVETVAYHHAPGAAGEGPPAVLAAVHVADACVEARMTGASIETLEACVDREFLDRAALSEELPRWLAVAKEPPAGRVARAS